MIASSQSKNVHVYINAKDKKRSINIYFETQGLYLHVLFKINIENNSMFSSMMHKYHIQIILIMTECLYCLE